MIDSSAKIPSLKVPNDKPNPPAGVGVIAWSSDSAFLATKNGSFCVRIIKNPKKSR